MKASLISLFTMISTQLGTTEPVSISASLLVMAPEVPEVPVCGERYEMAPFDMVGKLLFLKYGNHQKHLNTHVNTREFDAERS